MFLTCVIIIKACLGYFSAASAPQMTGPKWLHSLKQSGSFVNFSTLAEDSQHFIQLLLLWCTDWRISRGTTSNLLISR